MTEIKLMLFAILFVYLGDAANAFDCPAKGVFADPDSNDCKTFIACDANLNAKINSCAEYNDLGPTYFWPEKNGCFSDYNCATQSMPGNENPCEGFTNYENIPDKNSADCSEYLFCSTSYVYNVDNSYLEIPSVFRRICPSGTVFQPRRGCVSASSYTCVNFQCSTEGSFVNTNNNDCTTYVACTKFRNNGNTASVLYPKLKTCPPDTKFSPFSRKCDELYSCGGVDPYDGTDPCLNYNWASPFVRDPHSNDCSTYLECYQDSDYNDGHDVIVRRTCPPSTKFAPIAGKCYYNHECNQSCSKDPCINGVGKFVDLKSGQCENYLECRDTSTVQILYRPVYEKVYCPPGTLFSPVTSDCDKDYLCPKFAVNYCYPEIPTTPPPTTTTTSAP